MENQRVALNWKCFEIVQVVLAVVVPTGLASHPLITLKAELGKPKAFFKACLVVVIDVVPPISNCYTISGRNPSSVNPN